MVITKMSQGLNLLFLLKFQWNLSKIAFLTCVYEQTHSLLLCFGWLPLFCTPAALGTPPPSCSSARSATTIIVILARFVTIGSVIQLWRWLPCWTTNPSATIFIHVISLPFHYVSLHFKVSKQMTHSEHRYRCLLYPLPLSVTKLILLCWSAEKLNVKFYYHKKIHNFSTFYWKKAVFKKKINK